MSRRGAGQWWGMRWAAAFTAARVLVALGMFMTEGRAPFTHDGATVGQAIALYVAGGVIVGTCMGRFRPRTVDQTRSGSMFW